MVTINQYLKLVEEYAEYFKIELNEQDTQALANLFQSEEVPLNIALEELSNCIQWFATPQSLAFFFLTENDYLIEVLDTLFYDETKKFSVTDILPEHIRLSNNQCIYFYSQNWSMEEQPPTELKKIKVGLNKQEVNEYELDDNEVNNVDKDRYCEVVIYVNGKVEFIHSDFIIDKKVLDDIVKDYTGTIDYELIDSKETRDLKN